MEVLLLHRLCRQWSHLLQQYELGHGDLAPLWWDVFSSHCGHTVQTENRTEHLNISVTQNSLCIHTWSVYSLFQIQNCVTLNPNYFALEKGKQKKTIKHKGKRSRWWGTRGGEKNSAAVPLLPRYGVKKTCEHWLLLAQVHAHTLTYKHQGPQMVTRHRYKSAYCPLGAIWMLHHVNLSLSLFAHTHTLACSLGRSQTLVCGI